jgi:histidinol dehydrogenase
MHNDLVYSGISRRAGGISIGINLFPDGKLCSFGCPYCEVFPVTGNTPFDLSAMEKSLIEVVLAHKARGDEIKDICFSGNGEPTLSQHFFDALDIAVKVGRLYTPESKTVVITNGTGLLYRKAFEKLVAAANEGVCVWLKIDAGTQEWFRKINRPGSMNLLYLLHHIEAFAKSAPFIAQTMLCSVGGQLPSDEESKAWVDYVSRLDSYGKLTAVHIYSKSRPSPDDPACQPVDKEYLERRANQLRKLITVPVDTFI